MAEKDFSASLLASSDIVFDFYCQPCSTEDLHLEAAGYCQNCHEYLCDNCCRYHKKSTLSRHHKVLDKATMPKDGIKPKINDTLTEMCQKHNDKVLEFFCDTHNDICCSVCLTLDHISCQKKYVPEISAGVANSREHKDVVLEFDRLVALATSEQSNIDMDKQDNDNYRDNAISNIKETKKRVEILFDKIVEDSVQKINELHQSNATKINTVTTKCQKVLSDAQQTALGLKEKATGRKNNQLFVEMKLARSRIPYIEDEINDATKRKISRYVFDQDEKVQEMMSTLSAIWSLSVRQDGGDTKARYLRDVCVKSEEDKNDCYINGIEVLPGDRMVVTDVHNSAVKLVDVKMNKVTSLLSLSSMPFDVTRTQPDQVAAALGNEGKIEILTVSDVLSRSHIIDVPGDRFTGLCYDGENFIVVCDQARAVKKVTMSGRVVSTVFTDSNSDPLFKFPRYITLSRSQDVVYVSDRGGGTVTCLTLTGRVIAVYSHTSLEKARGVAVGADGRVYVCNSGSHSVHQLTASGKHVTVLLDKEHGLSYWPCAITYSVDDDTLAISSNSTAPQYQNYVKLFKLE